LPTPTSNQANNTVANLQTIPTNNLTDVNQNTVIPVTGMDNSIGHVNAVIDTPLSAKSAITNTNTYDLDSNVNKMNLQEQDVTIIDDEKERPISPKVSMLRDAISDVAIKTNISNENMNHVNLGANMTHQ